MNTTKIKRAKSNSPREPFRFTKRLGSIVYEVEAHFSPDAKEEMDEKLLRLLQRDLGAAA